MRVTIEAIAKTCHSANKALCESIRDMSQVIWEQADGWQKASVMEGVKFYIDHPEADAEDSHNAWLKQKIATGWKHGEHKDPDQMTHPNIMDFEDMPEEQQLKDHLFGAICKTMIPMLQVPKPLKSKVVKEVHPDDEALKMDSNKPAKKEALPIMHPSGKAMKGENNVNKNKQD